MCKNSMWFKLWPERHTQCLTVTDSECLWGTFQTPQTTAEMFLKQSENGLPLSVSPLLTGKGGWVKEVRGRGPLLPGSHLRVLPRGPSLTALLVPSSPRGHSEGPSSARPLGILKAPTLNRAGRFM